MGYYKCVIDMSSIFATCDSLKSLPNISINRKLPKLKVKDMTAMSMGCTSLVSLPDISIWKIFKVENMNALFFGYNLFFCLISLNGKLPKLLM